MALNLRITDDLDQAIERLAARWQLSKQAAITRAVLEADRREAGLSEVHALTRDALAHWADGLDQLSKL